MKRFVHEASPMDMLEKFEGRLKELNSSDYIKDEWEMLARKDVYDFDDFLTEYTLWTDNNGQWVTFFGDSDIYNPNNLDISDADMEFESEDEAWDWFEEYQTDIDPEY